MTCQISQYLSCVTRVTLHFFTSHEIQLRVRVRVRVRVKGRVRYSFRTRSCQKPGGSLTSGRVRRYVNDDDWFAR